MNDIVKVSAGLANIRSDFTSLFTEYDSLEQSLENIRVLLDDTSLWDSKVQRKTMELHEVMVQYVKAIRPICKSLQECVEGLEDDADNFAKESRNVGKLW